MRKHISLKVQCSYKTISGTKGVESFCHRALIVLYLLCKGRQHCREISPQVCHCLVLRKPACVLDLLYIIAGKIL